MSWTITPQIKSLDGVPIGMAYGGGYVAGFISHTANGKPTHALIIAPQSSISGAWKTSLTSTSGTVSTFDGLANTNSIITAGISSHPAAQTCVGNTSGGFTDWYMPAILELEIAYRNFKPTTQINVTNDGSNAYAVPTATGNYSESLPAQTLFSLFQSGQSAAFPASGLGDVHYSSTEAASSAAAALDFRSGDQFNLGKNNAPRYVRAFRRIAL